MRVAVGAVAFTEVLGVARGELWPDVVSGDRGENGQREKSL